MNDETETTQQGQAENETQQQRIARLEKELQSLQEDAERYRKLIELSPDGIGIHRKNQFLYMNERGIEIMGAKNLEEVQTRSVIEYVHPDYRHLVQKRVETTQEEGAKVNWLEEQFIRLDGQVIDVEVSGTPIMYRGEPASQVIFRDITERKEAEQARQELQEQQYIIEAQKLALRELSTPLIPLSSEVVLMPLVGSIDSNRAQLVMETLLEGIAHYQADTAILDITGVSVMDTQVANALVQSARAVRLLGARIILTGIGATMAQTLVHLEADLGMLQTRGSLQSAIEEALLSSS
jgi:rsbT co-antagonist protein RsbR